MVILWNKYSKLLKSITVIMICIITCVFFTSCKDVRSDKIKPASQNNTTWSSTDGTIVFNVVDYNEITGTMLVGGETVEILVWFDFSYGMKIYSKDLIEASDLSSDYSAEDYMYENWRCLYVNEDLFVACVIDTSYYEKGNIFVFRKQG